MDDGLDGSRELVIDRLGSVQYARFLVYLMGPYKSFNLNYILDPSERQGIEVDELPGPLRKLFRRKKDIDEAKALLRRVQGQLRADPGVNAFLAVDVGIDTDDVDAVTQSIQFARASNTSIFVVPFLGHNFGVGEESGSVLENVAETHGDRIIFLHEEDVTSEMIRSARERWDLRIERYAGEDELVRRVRLFVVDVMNREQYSDLDPLE